jgi:hypothetical protein
MRMGKAFQVATVCVAWIVWQMSAAVAQEGASVPPAQLIGPLYAYGPAPVPVEAYRYPRQRSQSRYGYSNYRPRARYGSYSGSRFADRPEYQPRYRGSYNPSFGYGGRSVYPSYGYRQRYAARIVTPRWYGNSQPALATEYRPPW